MCIDKVSSNNHFLLTVNKPSNKISDFIFGFCEPIVTFQNILNGIYLWFYYHGTAETLLLLNDKFETPEETFFPLC